MEHEWHNADWDSVRLFIHLDRTRSFRKTAEDVGQSINTIRRTIARLEDQLGYSLFVRSVEGVHLTDEGRRMIGAAREVEQTMSDMWRVARTSARSMRGQVRVAITEGIGTFWLTPRLVDFMEREGDRIHINLECAMRSVDVLRLEADISVQLVEPTTPDLLVRRLGWLHLTPFASKGYLDRHGTPESFADLARHHIIEQRTDQLSGYDLDKVFGADIANRMVRMTTNFSSAHYWAIAKGAGIGLLPNYAIAIGADVVPVDLGIEFRTGIWMATHPNVADSPRHRHFIDWLATCFNDRTNPWFGPEKMHPYEVAKAFEAEERQTYFGGFTPRLLSDMN